MTSLLGESIFNELLEKLNGREQLPGHVRKHISVCVDNLTRKVDKSLNVLATKQALVEQRNALQDGRVPASHLRSVWMHQS